MAGKKGPLGMNEGSVRAIMTLFLVVAIISAWIASIFTGFEFPGELIAIPTFIIGYYYKARQDNK